ncbi:MAG: hypothetical protein V4539_19805 [Bacteroidota bacterium]
MPRFVVYLSEKQKRKKQLYAIGHIISGILFVTAFACFSDHRNFIRIAYLLFSINGFALGYEGFRKMGKVKFVDIDMDRIEWSIYERSNNHILIEWSDVRWIKKEKDGSISVFRDSSFSNNLSLNDLREEDKKEILILLEQYARGRGIHLINFSDLALALV